MAGFYHRDQTVRPKAVPPTTACQKKSGPKLFAKATQSKNGNTWSSINLLMAQF